MTGDSLVLSGPRQRLTMLNELDLSISANGLMNRIPNLERQTSSLACEDSLTKPTPEIDTLLCRQLPTDTSLPPVSDTLKYPRSRRLMSYAIPNT